MNQSNMWMRPVAAIVCAVTLCAGAAQAQALQAGDPAPAFAVTATTGKTVTLADFAGKKAVVLFFYPAAFTST